jgi:hypothetical protein
MSFVNIDKKNMAEKSRVPSVFGETRNMATSRIKLLGGKKNMSRPGQAGLIDILYYGQNKA